MIQTGIDDKQTRKPTMSLAELFDKDDELKQTYEKIRYGNYVKMEQVIDRPIIVLGFSIAMEKSKYKDEQQEFMRMRFLFTDEEDGEERECRTQSKQLINTLKAVGSERIEEAGGFYTMVCRKKEGTNTILWFDGIE